MGKITKEQLSDGLLRYISQNAGSGNTNGGTASIEFKKNSVTISAPSNKIAIGINGYNKDIDLLMVYKNTIYLEENVMYNISSDSLYITNPNGNWNESGTTLFNFIVIKGGTGGSSSATPGGGNYVIPDNSIAEVKLDSSLRGKINQIETLKNSVRYKTDLIVESDLDQELKEKLNIGGAKTWGSLKNELAKTWANLMGQ